MSETQDHLGSSSNQTVPARDNYIGTVQDALRKFAQHIGSQWVFDEASVALDAGRDYKLTITCTENGKGYIVAMHRHETERVGHNSFVKLAHGEWDARNGLADRTSPDEKASAVDADVHGEQG